MLPRGTKTEIARIDLASPTTSPMNDQLEPLLTKEDGEIVTPVHRARGRRELWLLAAVYAGITAVLVCTGFRDLRGLVPQGLGEYKEELVACPSAEAAAVQAPRRSTPHDEGLD